MAPVVLPALRPTLPPELEPEVNVDQKLVLEELPCEQVVDWRARAATDAQLVTERIERYDESSGRRRFTGGFVGQVQCLSSLRHLNSGFAPWGQG
ncbi:hypothetical protein [Streptomyces sp. NPDC003077]|uniref:hypothetical protein n=1 Tax=Streptomyces sp. NPDC003077 TaxID=3154443 RepID=UPI0033AF5108